MRDLPETGLVLPLTIELHSLRDLGMLVITAKKVDLIVNGDIRMPTVLRKSYGKRGISNAFEIPGFTGKSQQGVDLHNLFDTYKVSLTNDQRKKWIADLPILIKCMLEKGRIPESIFDELEYPTNTDSDNIEQASIIGGICNLSFQ